MNFQTTLNIQRSSEKPFAFRSDKKRFKTDRALMCGFLLSVFCLFPVSDDLVF